MEGKQNKNMIDVEGRDPYLEVDVYIYSTVDDCDVPNYTI